MFPVSRGSRACWLQPGLVPSATTCIKRIADRLRRRANKHLVPFIVLFAEGGIRDMKGRDSVTRETTMNVAIHPHQRSKGRSGSKARSGGRQSGFGFGVFSEWRGGRTLDSGALGASSVCYFRATARRDAARCISPLSTVRPPFS